MRIQNNITAMNTHRQYTINNDNVAKAAEKLSSGYRINRAGDDAAGLAISEKMRSQIRGLNMATKNSQDAISLVQTAEGALQETHSMLQRMNELAVQAATGTNQEEDRLALAKEFDQLKKEINDIAEQTTFNNMKVLDGSLSYTGPQRSAATSGITTTEKVLSANAGALTSEVTTAGVKEKITTPGKAATVEFDLAGMSVTGNPNRETATIAVTIGGQAGNLTSKALAAGETSADKIAAKFDGETVSVGGTTYTASVKGTKLTLTAATEATTTLGTASIATPTISNLEGNSPSITAPTATAGSVTEGVTEVKTAGTAQVETFTVDADKVAYGDVIEIGDKKFEIVKTGEAAKTTGAEAIEWTGNGTDDLGALLEAAQNQPTKVTITATTDGAFTVTQKAGQEGIASTKAKYVPDSKENVETTIEIDAVKLKEGDQIKISIDGEDYTYTVADGDYAKDVIEGLGLTAKGNAIVTTGNVEIDFTPRTEDEDNFNAMRIQVGALENEQLNISIDSMNTKGLDLDDSNLYTQDSAGKAITAVRDAVEKVSDQRATLGAMQNRLDHKIANLKVSSENLSAAESRIRDVDMASEMTNFTKNNILSQAATAMLAQANSLPQNVLSLLG